jgi:hypothetical protein
MFFSE